MKTEIFPDTLKIAKVKPLYKKGDNLRLNNCMPNSLLPTISKKFQRIMHTQLYPYFDANNLLSERQYGFRSPHSTELACIKLVDYITTELDSIKKIKLPAAIYVDLSKALSYIITCSWNFTFFDQELFN